MYLVCWNGNCGQTYPAENYMAEDRNVKCEKCGGVVISPSGKVQITGHATVFKTIDPDRTIECPECCGSGFSQYGSGYDAICDECSGKGEVLNPNYKGGQ